MSAKSLDRFFKNSAMKDIGMQWGIFRPRGGYCCGPKNAEHKRQAHKTSRRTMKKMSQEDFETHYGREGDRYADFDR